MLATLTTRLWTALAAIGGALALLGGAWLKGRSAGTQAARVRQMQEAAKQRTTRDEIDRAVSREPDPSGELFRDWSRRE